MANWSTPSEFPDRFGFEVTGRSTATGWLLVILGIFTGFIALCGVLVLAFAEEWSTIGIGLFVSLIGGVGVYAAVTNWRRDYRQSIWFDRQAREVRLRNTATRQQDYRIAFAQCQRLYVFSPYESGERGRTDYGLALITRDGSELVLDPGPGRERVTALADQLANFTGLPVTTFEHARNTQAASDPIDTIDTTETLNTTDANDRRREFSSLATASQFVRERSTSEGREIRVQTARMTTSAKIINLLVPGVFFAVPTVILASTYLQTSGSERIIILFFGGTFCLAFYAAVLLIILIQMKDYALILRSDRVLVRIEYRTPFARLFQRTIEVPADKIKGVPINLSREGHFWLALNVAGNYSVAAASLFLAGAGAFKKGISEDLKRNRIPLWEINAQLPPDRNSASVADFESVAAIVRSELGL